MRKNSVLKMTAFNTAFLIKNAAALQWTAALVLLNVIIGTFYRNQGHWEFDSLHAGSVCNLISLFIYTLIALRLFKYRDNLNIQLMILLLFLPKPDEQIMAVILQIFVVLVVFTRWLSIKKTKQAILILSGAVVAAPVNMLFLDLATNSPTPKGGKLIASTDNLFKLYSDRNNWAGETTYRLNREVPICTGLRLVKQIDKVTTNNSVRILRSPKGNYFIDENRADPQVKQITQKSGKHLAPPGIPHQ